MQTLPEKTEGTNCQCTMEQRLARLGAKVDQLIDKAEETQADAQERGSLAVQEMKSGLKTLREELTEVWQTARDAGQKVGKALFPKEKSAKKCETEDKPVPCVTPTCPHHGTDFCEASPSDELEGII
jgi:hypothetical protein